MCVAYGSTLFYHGMGGTVEKGVVAGLLTRLTYFEIGRELTSKAWTLPELLQCLQALKLKHGPSLKRSCSSKTSGGRLPYVTPLSNLYSSLRLYFF